ncbi:MAG TPA: o-succinylbenzoate synthase [Terriglobales bacterium]|nr:o-succinylbenzoate synthase [Terriglobales bacterium]
MKIETVTLREIRMPLVSFFETSFARMHQRRILLLQVVVDGVEGWGEVTCGEAPYYNHEATDTAAIVLRDFAIPLALGFEFEHPAQLAARLSRIRGNAMARAALENAVWDARAKREGQPLWKLLGGTRTEIACGVSIGIKDSVGDLLETIEHELADGYQRIKIKIKPGWDVDVLEQVRGRFPTIPLMGDANSAYTLDDLDHLKRFDAFHLMMLEQPLWHDDIHLHARLQSAIATPVCLDEAIHHARDARQAIDIGACRIINVKLGRVGGFTSALAVHEATARAGMPVWCGGMLESGVGRAHNIALSTLANFTLPGDVSASKRYWSEDIIEPEVTVTPRGTIQVPTAPGMGFAVNLARVKQLSAWEQTFR